MRKAIAKYKGKQGACYFFLSQQGEQILFTKCRKDLIEQFKLDLPDNIDQWFQINFFQAFPNARMDTLDEMVNIISDLRIVTT
ncbi:MAG: hypothetical protein KDD41_08385 [Flavobacteriales bacterium]|nr:hypothetical protein [Flavobacteriales bacterium]